MLLPKGSFFSAVCYRKLTKIKEDSVWKVNSGKTPFAGRII